MLDCFRKGNRILNSTVTLELILFQVFMTRRDTLQCLHEPFGDAFYYGPERLSSRYENDEKARLDSGFAHSTFRTVMERIEKEGTEVRITPSTVAASPAAPFFVAQRCK